MHAYTICLVNSQSAVQRFGSSCFDIKLLETYKLGNMPTRREHMVAMGDQMVKMRCLLLSHTTSQMLMLSCLYDAPSAMNCANYLEQIHIK